MQWRDRQRITTALLYSLTREFGEFAHATGSGWPFPPEIFAITNEPGVPPSIGRSPVKKPWPTSILSNSRTRGRAMSRGHSSYVPRTKVGRWLEARLPVPRLVHGQFIVYPVPRNLNYAYS